MIPAMPCTDSETDARGGTIVDCAFNLHTTLGPGLVESVYQSGADGHAGETGTARSPSAARGI